MSVQSRRKPSKLFTATVWGVIWAVLFIIAPFLFVRETLQEIRNQDEGRYTQGYITWYLIFILIIFLIILAVIAFCSIGRIEASKQRYLITVQLVNFTALLGTFWGVLILAGGNGFAFFLGNPEAGVVSLYEAFFIWLLFLVGAPLQMLSVMNDKYRNEIRIGVGGILFIISIFLPNMLNSYALLRATCTSPLPEGAQIKEQCQERAIELIPMFKMAIAFAAALTLLFFFSMLSPRVARLISSLTGDGAQTQQNLPGQELETAVQPSYAEPLPSAVRRNSHFGTFTAAVLGGVVVWTIQTVGKRISGPR